jgi:WD40 repeat protein
LLLTLPIDEMEVRSVAFSPDGAWIAAAGAGGFVRLWDGRPPP